MSGKSKKTTADRTVKNDQDSNNIVFSTTRVTKQLSLSFYGEDTLKNRKQVIYDDYGEFEETFTPQKNTKKHFSYSKPNIRKPKTPIIRIKPDLPPSIFNTKVMKPNKELQERNKDGRVSREPKLK